MKIAIPEYRLVGMCKHIRRVLENSAPPGADTRTANAARMLRREVGWIERQITKTKTDNGLS